MNKKNTITATVILALLAGVAWALFSGEDAEVAEAKQMRDDLFQKVETMSRDERRANFESLREKTRDFSEDQRRAFGQGMRQFFMKRVDKLLAMPPEERNKELDKWIDRMEEWGANREGREGREGRGDRGGDMTSAERDQRRKQRLDRSTPEMRAKMDRMKDLINDRREERGLDPIQGGRGMFGSPHGRGGPR